MKLDSTRMSVVVRLNYMKYLEAFPNHEYEVYESAAGWNVWDNVLWVRISLEPEWFARDMEKHGIGAFR